MKRIVILIFLLTVSCTSSTSYPSKSLLESSTCKLPCWNGIVPGKTDEDEALLLISSLPIVDSKSILQTGQQWAFFDNQIYFSFKPPYASRKRGQGISVLDIKEHSVSGVTLCGDTHTTIGAIIEDTGEPESIFVGGTYGGGRFVNLINPQIGIAYWYDTGDGSRETESEITPSTHVDCILLFDPAIYELMLESKLLTMGLYGAQETLEIIYSWDGYGNLDEKYPMRWP